MLKGRSTRAVRASENRPLGNGAGPHPRGECGPHTLPPVTCRQRTGVQLCDLWVSQRTRGSPTVKFSGAAKNNTGLPEAPENRGSLHVSQGPFALKGRREATAEQTARACETRWQLLSKVLLRNRVGWVTRGCLLPCSQFLFCALRDG